MKSIVLDVKQKTDVRRLGAENQSTKISEKSVYCVTVWQRVKYIQK